MMNKSTKFRFLLLSYFLTLGIFVFGQQKSGQSIDRIVAIIGENPILHSDIENQYMQYLMQGNITNPADIRCQIIEEILFSKLLLNQAKLDSIEVSEQQVESEMDRRIQYFISQIGSAEKLEEYYSKSILEIKNDLRTVIKEQMLSEQIQRGIIENVKITPTEVREFYEKIPQDSLPLIQMELGYSELVIIPKVSAEEKNYARLRLEELRNRILKGEDFASLAKIYSEDQGSSVKGGELGDFTRGVMYPEFEAAAFALKDKEISPIIETEAGFHILQLIQRKGDYVNVRHILIMTKVSPYSLTNTKLYLDSIANLINSGKMTFDEAVVKFSEGESKMSGGKAINPSTGNAVFSLDDFDNSLRYTVDRMNVGEITKSMQFQYDRTKVAYRLVRLDKKTKAHTANLQTDYDRIQEAALNDKKSKAIQQWIQKKVETTYIKFNDEELKNCNFQNKWF